MPPEEPTNANSEGGAPNAAPEGGNGALHTPAIPDSVSYADLKALGLPESYFGQDGTLNAKDLTAHLGEFATMKTQAEERAKAVPADGKYDFALPKDWKAPDGVKLSDDALKSWKVSDAKAAAFAAYAKAKGMTQAEVSDFVKEWASADAMDKMSAAKAENDFYAAEMQKLGADAKGRLESIGKFLSANLSKEQMGAVAMMMTDAAAVEGIEKLVNLALGSKPASRTEGAGTGSGSEVNGQPVDPLMKLYPTMSAAAR